MNDWKTRMHDALAAGGCASRSEWVARYPGVHCWFSFSGNAIESCASCGVVRKRNDSNKPCKGIVTVVLRGET